jgi:hypothetical protein
LLAGRFLCLLAGDWQNGLPHLAKGSDAAMRDAALKDLHAGKTPEGREALGEAWSAIADKQTVGLVKQRLQERAAHWYKLALPDMTGLKKARVEKQLAAIVSGGAVQRKYRGERGVAAALRKLVAAIPPDLRPGGKGFTRSVQLGEWLGKQPGDSFDTLINVQYSGFDSARDALIIDVAPSPSETIDGFRWAMVFHIQSKDEQHKTAFKSIKRGTTLRMMGTVERYRLGAYLTDAAGVVNGLTIAAQVNDVRFAEVRK